MPSSLYIHIPFCLKRCLYCDFVSGLYDPEKADAYVEALIREMQGIPDKHTLATLFIGGGTPTALGIKTLSKLLSSAFNRFNFNDNYEATIEANPGTVDREKLNAIRSSGINRISLGVQSFNDNDLSFLGRIHSEKEAEQAVRLAGKSGFKNIGIDLIYGIPGQDINSWKSSLDKAVRLKPGHISTYELTVEKGTGLYELIKSSGGNPPGLIAGRKVISEDEIIEIYDYTIEHLLSEGYIHYEISNFALPGYVCRHNTNYWERGEYYGAGLGAHSFMDGKRVRNTDSLDEYLGLISEGKAPVKNTEFISDDKAFSEAVFLGLRKTEGINVEPFAKKYRKNILTDYRKEIKELHEAGLIKVTVSDCAYESNVRLTRKGLLLSNEVFAKFI